MITVRKAQDRGRMRLRWLEARHTFSFGHFFDPEFTEFRSLRVLNDDIIAGGGGFDTHPHDNMEIITYPLDGALEHRDSTGGGGVIRHGDIQVMTAGSGLTHSEFNHSSDEPARLLQIWIMPAQRDLEPRYQDKNFPLDERRGRLALLASNDARDGSLKINQDVSVYSTILAAGESVEHAIGVGRHVWVQIARGSATVNGEHLKEGDGAAISDESSVSISADTDAELLLFDLA